MTHLVFVFAAMALVFVLAMRRSSLTAWAIAAAVLTFFWQTGPGTGGFGFWNLVGWLPAIALAVIAAPGVRRSLIIEPAFRTIRGVLPKVSETEQQALDAGTIGFDAELFSGRPDWNKLRSIPPIILTAEEQAFLDGPTEELCRMIDDWHIRHNEREIPEEIWSFVKRHGFLGMLISKAHGGLGFSAQAQSLILGKIASSSRSSWCQIRSAQASSSRNTGRKSRSTITFRGWRAAMRSPASR
jgi:acyl-CoA dehydrogenase